MGARSIERIGIVGFGYVGQGVAHAFRSVAEVAHHDPVSDASEPLAELVRWAEAVFVCVPTPAGPEGAPDLDTVHAVLTGIAAAAPAALVVVKS